MKWSWKITTISGIDVFTHATFLLIIGWVDLSYWQQTGTFAGTLDGILFTLILFGCASLHEFGHARTVRRYGIKIRTSLFIPSAGLPVWSVCPEQTYSRILGSSGRPGSKCCNRSPAFWLADHLRHIGAPRRPEHDQRAIHRTLAAG